MVPPNTVLNADSLSNVNVIGCPYLSIFFIVLPIKFLNLVAAPYFVGGFSKDFE